jgi:predicted DNA-binding ribbon-helix-helix protein
MMGAAADSVSDASGVAVMKSPVAKRSIVVAGHKTSVSLEEEFWEGLKEIAGKRDMTLSALVGTIDEQRQQGNLSSALRLFVLEFYRSRHASFRAAHRHRAQSKLFSSLE